MIYRRDESYRFAFSQPIPCSYTIVGIGGTAIQSNTANGEIMDLSPQGCRLQSLLNIHLEKEVTLKVEFKLDEGFAQIITTGTVKWQKRKGLSHYQYGIEFVKDDRLKHTITEELKKYVKR
ncbi:PilZ domain-containing protein [Bacillus sp. RO3]|nr:PilZ domain-containing protein [Bacillus sp. RO3]